MTQASAPAAARPWRTPLALLALVAGLGLLAWVARSAFDAMSAEDWQRLAEAEWWRSASLAALAAVGVALNGAMWWLALRPQRRISLADALAVNAVATLLAYAPGKFSVLFRVAWHRRVDGVAVLTFGGWMAAVGATLAAAVLPAMLLAAPLAPGGGARAVGEAGEAGASLVPWAIASLLGAAACGEMGVRLSRFFATGSGWRWLLRAAFRVAGRRGVRVMRSPPVQNLHAGLRMLSDRGSVFGGVALRLLDISATAVRFAAAAGILGVALAPAQAAAAGLAYFLIAAAAPTGAAGAREAGTAGVLTLLGLNLDEIAPVVLIVAAGTLVGDTLCAAAGGVWLALRRAKPSPAYTRG